LFDKPTAFGGETESIGFNLHNSNVPGLGCLGRCIGSRLTGVAALYVHNYHNALKIDVLTDDEAIKNFVRFRHPISGMRAIELRMLKIFFSKKLSPTAISDVRSRKFYAVQVTHDNAGPLRSAAGPAPFVPLSDEVTGRQIAVLGTCCRYAGKSASWASPHFHKLNWCCESPPRARHVAVTLLPSTRDSPREPITGGPPGTALRCRSSPVSHIEREPLPS
jgi:hypothetical protein